MSVLALLFGVVSQEAPVKTDVWTAKTEGYHSFRIPSVIVTSKNTVLAFCEARKKNRSDWGDIDLVLRRSSDGGATWGPMQMVWDDGPNTCGNPCPVIDRNSGTIWLLLTHNLGVDPQAKIVDGTSQGSRTAWVCKSEDDGQTWSKPVEITKDVKKADWTWYATGPGVGIQTRTGRFVIPCDHTPTGTKEEASHVFYSDDAGKTWQLGGKTSLKFGESQVVELADGTLMLNMRNHESPRRERGVSLSKDGGLTWSEPVYDATLVEPVCQASILRYTLAEKSDKNRLLFSNPAGKGRNNLTVRVSYDEGKTWPVARLLHGGPAAYSCLTVLPDLSVGCLYEGGEKEAYDRIVFARFSLSWLTEGKDRIERK